MALVLAFTQALGLLATYLLFTKIYNKLSLKQPSPFPLPPSPPADPLIGHLRKIPLVHAEHTFVEWAKKYGEVTYLNILGRHVVVLNSKEAAYELLEKRGALHSDRPDMIVWDIMGWGNALSFLHYGDSFRRQRKLMNSHLSVKACNQHQSMQLENARLLVGHLMEAKGEYAHALTHFSTAIIMRITYGHQISSDGDEYVALAANALASAEESGVPGGTPIDYFPILQYLPSWFPGTHYANVARRWQNHVQRFRNIPFEYVVKQMAEGTSKPSFLGNMLGRFNGRTLSDEEREDLKDAAAVMYGAGVGTTAATLGLFFMAMLENPECQKLAQNEIDRVVGKDRLPTFEDHASLLYVGCLVQELFRWNPVIPLGLMHRSIEDDVYKGMFIPKGSLIYPNVLAMSLDENYSNPTAFNPSRFMPKSDGGGGEPLFPSAFGFGRRYCTVFRPVLANLVLPTRICPGRHLAYASVWVAVATILSTLNITRKKDKDGNDIPLHFEFASGITNHPKPVPCNILPRSETVAHLVQTAIRSVR